MQPLGWILFDLLVHIFESGMIVGFVFKTLECKVHTRYQKLLFIIPVLLLFGLLTLFRYTNVFEGIALICYASITVTLATVFFYGTVMKKVLLSTLPILFIAVSNAIGLNLTALLFQQSPTNLLDIRDAYYVFFVAIAHVLFFLLWYILKSCFNRNNAILTKTEWLFLSVVIAVSVVIFILTVAVIICIQLYHIGLYSAEDGIQLYIGMTMLFLITMDFTVCFLFVQLSKKRTIVTENALLRQQYEFGEKSATDIKRQYDNLRKMRHDYKNVLLIIQGLNAGGKQQEIDTFIAGYLSETDSTPTIVTTDNEYVNATVNLKIAHARESDITVTVDMPTQIHFEHPIDLCNLLGNLFDNAIEACIQCPKPNRCIHLSFTQKNKQFVLFMKNSIAESVLKTNPYLLTQKKDKARHGYGTRIIKETAKKHHGFADFYEEDGFFCCNVVLYQPKTIL